MKYLYLMSCVLFCMCGCSNEDRSYSVKIVIPDEYKGLIKIKFNTSGEKQTWDQNTLVFAIPQSGILVVQGDNPFLKSGSGMVVLRTSGKTVDCAFRMQNPPKDAILFRTIGGTNDGKEYWAIIGTASEAEDASIQLGDYQSKQK